MIIPANIRPDVSSFNTAAYLEVPFTRSLRGIHGAIVICQTVSLIFQKVIISKAGIAFALGFETGLLVKKAVSHYTHLETFDRALLRWDNDYPYLCNIVVCITVIAASIFPKYGLPVLSIIGCTYGYMFSLKHVRE